MAILFFLNLLGTTALSPHAPIQPLLPEQLFQTAEPKWTDPFNVLSSRNSDFSTGKISQSVGTGNAFARAITYQSDGKLLVAITALNGSNQTDFMVARYYPDGSLDTDFGTNGFARADVGGNDLAHAITLDSNDRIFVVGRASGWGDYDLGIACFSSDGSLDTDFGSSGMIRDEIGDGMDFGRGVQVDSNNKLAIVAYTSNGDDVRF